MEACPHQPQPIDVLLLGAGLRAVGDPDAEIMALYAIGVPLGLNVELPRTPAVFTPKTKWSLREQQAWGGEFDKAAHYKGATRANYASVVGHAEAVERVLRGQEAAGWVLVMSEADARARYGDRLTIASVAALEKGLTDDAIMIARVVRVLHDRTHGVNVNRYILVRDGGVSPTAIDLKTTMRLQAATGLPHCGLTVDVDGGPPLRGSQRG